MKAGIAGGGIMGRLLALYLLQEGWQVTVFDKNKTRSQPNNCSYIAAGLLNPACELDKAATIIYKLGMESITQHWPRILRLLPKPFYFQQQGCLVVNHPQDRREWVLFRERINSKINNLYQPLTQNELRRLEPELSKFDKAYFFPHEAQIDSQASVNSLGEYISHLGGEWHCNTEVQSVSSGTITIRGSSYSYDVVFDCRGLGAQSLFTEVRGVRGELIHLYAPDVKLQRPIRFLHPRYTIYLVPRPNHVYLLGASEIESEDTSSISVRTTLELLTAAYYLHAGFSEARIIKTATHCRPTLSNHLPRINALPGLIAVNGLYRHGYLIAPSLATEILRGFMSNYKILHYPELWEILL